MISSRTPEGEPNVCPVCGHDFRLEPSRPPGDGPCPACGHLTWFPADSPRRAAYLNRYTFPLGVPFVAWVGGASGRLGFPSPDEAEFLAGIASPDDARRLKRLSRSARSWAELIGRWREEAPA